MILQNSGEITLSTAVPFSEAFQLIDRSRHTIFSYLRGIYYSVREWPGSVDLIVVGSDRERMKLRYEFSSESKVRVNLQRFPSRAQESNWRKNLCSFRPQANQFG